MWKISSIELSSKIHVLNLRQLVFNVINILILFLPKLLFISGSEMKLNVNKQLLPIKAHYFFFMASKIAVDS